MASRRRGGVQRATKFAKFLRDYGWEPIILSVASGNPPHIDASLLRDVASIEHVYRAKSLEPHALYKKLFAGKAGGPKTTHASSAQGHPLAEWIRLNLFIPDSRVGWRRPATTLGLELIRKHDIKMIFSSAPPYTAHRIAMALHHKTGTPWVADFRDPWFENFTYNTQYRLPPVKWLTKRMEQNVLQSAQAIVSVGKGLDALLRNKLPETEANRFHVIPNGYDPEDFSPAVPPPALEGFTIAYYGTLYHDGFPSVFTEALEAVCLNNPQFEKDLRIRLVGKASSDTIALFARFIPGNQLTVTPYIPHEEMLQALQAAQVLLLFISDVPHSNIILTGKIFEYLPTGNPILAIGPSGGDLDELLRSTHRGRTYNYTDKAGLMAELEHRYLEWSQTGNKVAAKRFPKYERKALAAELAAIFDDLCQQNDVSI